jgi:hypothetical protein
MATVRHGPITDCKGRNANEVSDLCVIRSTIKRPHSHLLRGTIELSTHTDGGTTHEELRSITDKTDHTSQELVVGN